jgi:hypothetical protein
MAHAFGPRSDRALQALHEVDQSLEQLWTVMRRVPEHRYDAYVLSDHGQSACTPYGDLMHGKRMANAWSDGSSTSFCIPRAQASPTCRASACGRVSARAGPRPGA